jgi:thymidylate kinase
VIDSDELLLARLPSGIRDANGVPDLPTRERRERALRVAGEVLADFLKPDGLRVSPLGPQWSSDIDAHVNRYPNTKELTRRGWVPLDGLLHAIGSEGSGRWAIVDDGEVLAGIDLTLEDVPDPLEAVLARSRRRREVRAREVLELRALHRSGVDLPSSDVVDAARRAESYLGADELGGSGDAAEPPIPLAWGRARKAAGRFKPRRGGRFAVALSGVDGSGKSTLGESLTADLDAAGVPVTRVWTRPGMSLKVLDSLARFVKRASGQKASPGIRTVAQGGEVRSRKGVVGWLWAVAITISFLADVRGQYRRAKAVVVFDRHLADALVTLDFAYGGVNLSLQRWLVRRWLPRADATIYLQVDADESVRRKPDEVFGRHAVERQLELYDRYLAEAPSLHVLPGAEPPADLRQRALRLVTTGV